MSTLPRMALCCLVLAAIAPGRLVRILPTAAPPAKAAAPQQAVPAKAEPETKDAEIQKRIQTTFGMLDRLKDVKAQVKAGVVTLSGQVYSSAARAEAQQLASKVQGVVTVENHIAIAYSIRKRLRPSLDKIADEFLNLLAMIPLLLIAIIVVLLFWLLGRYVSQCDWLFRRVSRNEFLRALLAQVARTVLVLLGLIFALQVLDAVRLVTAVLGTAGVVGLVVGFAFRDLAENYIASVLLSVRQPFLPHDFVNIDGHEGKVVRLTSRSTVLMTLDGNHLAIPNATVYKSIMRNYSTNPQRRFDFVVGVGKDADLARVQQAGLDAIKAMPGVLDSPPPDVWIDEVGDASVAVHFFGWIDQRATSFFKAKGEAIRLVKLALDKVKEAPQPPEPEKVPGLVAPSPIPAPQLDTTQEDHLDQQVAEERAAASEPDLLSSEETRKE